MAKSARRIRDRQALALGYRGPVHVQIPLPVLNALEDTRSAFFGLCVESGRQVLAAWMGSRSHGAVWSQGSTDSGSRGHSRRQHAESDRTGRPHDSGETIAGAFGGGKGAFAVELRVGGGTRSAGRAYHGGHGARGVDPEIPAELGAAAAGRARRGRVQERRVAALCGVDAAADAAVVVAASERAGSWRGADRRQALPGPLLRDRLGDHRRRRKTRSWLAGRDDGERARGPSAAGGSRGARAADRSRAALRDRWSESASESDPRHLRIVGGGPTLPGAQAAQRVGPPCRLR